MKGLIVSLLCSVAYVVLTAVLARLGHPRRHSKLFLLTLWACIPAYSALYRLTQPDLGFLPMGWQCASHGLDWAYGLVVFLLNGQTLIDVFFATCGGFSASLMSAIYQAGEGPVTTDRLVSLYRAVDGSDTLYAWRIPHLVKQGYFRWNPVTGRCTLSRRGRLIAVVTLRLKRLMNLGEGG